MAVLIVLAAIPLLGQNPNVGGKAAVGGEAVIGGGTTGGGYTISHVTGQSGGYAANSGSQIEVAYASNVTSGNEVIVLEKLENATSTASLTCTFPTKKSGTTSTLGTPNLDFQAAIANGSGGYYRICAYSVSVTGTGSLTFQYPASIGGSTYWIAEQDEFHPSGGSIVIDGTGVSNSSTGATETTGNISSVGGVVFMSSTENSTGDFTYSSPNGTNIFQGTSGSSVDTGEGQYLITTSGTYNLSISSGNSWFWFSIGVAYKAQ
jgi:hypothetical protein